MRTTAVILALACAVLAVPFNATLGKRQTYSNARLTWYDPAVGYGACGLVYQNTDYVSTSYISTQHLSLTMIARLGRCHELCCKQGGVVPVT